MHPLRGYSSGATIATSWAYAQPLADLQRRQSKGELLTREEKERLQKEATNKRKQNFCKR